MQEANINTEKTCGTNCICGKANCKCRLAIACAGIVFFILTIASIIYLFMQHDTQMKLIKSQAIEIDSIKASLVQDINKNKEQSYSFRKLFSNPWLLDKNPMDEIENTISDSFNKVFSRQKVQSRYSYLSTNSSEQEYTITVGLPGFTKDEITIELSDNILTINAKKITDTKTNEKTIDNKTTDDTDATNFVGEAINTEIQQAIKIPDDIDQENIKTSLKNGLLVISLPRTHRPADNIARKILID